MTNFRRKPTPQAMEGVKPVGALLHRSLPLAEAQVRGTVDLQPAESENVKVNQKIGIDIYCGAR